MKVTNVAIRPAEDSIKAGRPFLTPELLAATGARYSRNNEGLDAILAKIDPDNLDKSVDSIFRMIDYGHQSIADMVPVALFIDGISLWLAYYVWTLCPTASGQESSTRYINYASQETVDPEQLGIQRELHGEWRKLMSDCYRAYAEAVTIWEEIAAHDPAVARIPRGLLDDPADKAQKQVARMRRNYGFDRARYFLPIAAPTNTMLLMPARGWVQLCQYLLSHPLPEANSLGDAIRAELALSAPRLLKHATYKDAIANGIRQEFEVVRKLTARTAPEYLRANARTYECPPRASLEVTLPLDATPGQFAEDLRFHDNRYAWIGHQLKRTAVRFGWDAVAFGEIRDLNRHRTGTKWCPFAPVGFYAALDQILDVFGSTPKNVDALHDLAALGRAASARARTLLAEGDAACVYWTLLGTQYPFEHLTTADKFIYEAELRTGAGAHFRYARHLRDALALWYEQFPQTRGLILEGSAEPE
jgi:thymidylate synthase ThyX